MANISLKLDTRRLNKNGEYPIVFYLTHKTKNATIPAGVSVKKSDYNGDESRFLKASSPYASTLNNELYNALLSFKQKILNIKREKLEEFSVLDLKQYLLTDEETARNAKSFTEYARKHIQKYNGRTFESYKRTLELIDRYFHGKTIFFEDLTAGVLHSLDEEWAKTMNINSRAIYFRNLRAIINRAIDDEITSNYPFRKFKIKSVLKEKDYLPVEYMRKLVELQVSKQSTLMEITKDLFLLSFYLCGVNVNDIFAWKKDVLQNGKIVFVRKKIAHHEPDPIKLEVQPEAMAIIEKYKGNDYLLNFAETYNTNYDTFNGYLKHRIKRIGELIEYPQLSMYYARYSWATYADQLGVDEKVISKSLGHTDQSVAGRHYISYDWRRTDEANRKVIDYVLAQ